MSDRDGGTRPPMSDERLLQIKRTCANASGGDELVCPSLLGECLTEIDRLRAEAKLRRIDHAQWFPQDREAFLQQAIIELGAHPQAWRERQPGEQIATRQSLGDRPAHECAKRAIALWLAYVAIDRSEEADRG